MLRDGSKSHREVSFASHSDVVKFVENAAGSHLTAEEPCSLMLRSHVALESLL